MQGSSDPNSKKNKSFCQMKKCRKNTQYYANGQKMIEMFNIFNPNLSPPPLKSFKRNFGDSAAE